MTQTLSPQATIAQLEAENAQLRRENAQLWQERTWVEQVLAVPHDILSASHKITLIALKKELLDHAADEQGFREIETWKVVKSTGTSKDTVLSSIERGKQIGLLDKRKRRIQHAPGEYTTDFYVKENALLDYPEHYQAQGELFRKHGGKQQPKAACVYCGSEDLDRYEAQYCRACKETHFIPLEVAPEPWEKRQVANTDEPAESTADSIGELPPFPSPTVERQVANTEPERLLTRACLPPRWLRRKKNWCPWRYEEPEKPRADGKLDKVPYQTSGRVPQRAKTNDASTWSTYDEAQAFYEQSVREGWARPFEGIGMMCDGSFVGIDLDHCWDKETGEFTDEALNIVARFASYTYVTPNRGLRIVILAKKPGSRCKKGDIEIYEEKRFFTWTPERLDGTPDEIVNCQAELDALYKEVFPVEERKIENLVPNFSPCSCSDEKILEKARGAANGAKFRRLYDDGDITGYPSQSEADQALCEMLSYWGAYGDVSTINRLYQQSRLMRPKWFEPARAGETYGEGTIARAIALAMGEQERRAS